MLPNEYFIYSTEQLSFFSLIPARMSAQPLSTTILTELEIDHHVLVNAGVFLEPQTILYLMQFAILYLSEIVLQTNLYQVNIC